MTTTLRFNPDGIHIMELIGEQVTDLLPGLLPSDGRPGDEWDESLMIEVRPGRE